MTEKNLNALGIRKVGDLARLDEAFLEQRFGKWGLALAGKSRGLDAGGWFDTEIGADEGPKSISHEHTFSEDTADLAQIESTLARLCEMVGRRLREHRLHARTIQLKLRYSDFSTITRAHSIARATDLDTELFEEIRELFRRNWKAGARRAPAGRARFVLVRGRRADEPDRRREAPEMEPGAGGRRPAARQVRRIGRIAGLRPARQFPRAHPREPRRLAGEEEGATLLNRAGL